MFGVQYDGDDAPVTLWIDAKSADEARTIAARIHEGDEPARVIETPPGFFIVEVVVDDDGQCQTEPLDWVADTLALIEEHGAASAEDFVQPSEDDETCAVEAEADDGEVVACELASGHDERHQARTKRGDIVDW